MSLSLVSKKKSRRMDIGEEDTSINWVRVVTNFASMISALPSLQGRRSTGCVISSSISKCRLRPQTVSRFVFTPEEFQNLWLRFRIFRCIIAEDRFSLHKRTELHLRAIPRHFPQSDLSSFVGIMGLLHLLLLYHVARQRVRKGDL